ncbi:MAG: serine/arginine repetitive matrix protein 2 [Lachnospiraceae bacterium]|nr:serine/arginine repetitive matrix protein 2 [Lachnospiraceae bacterium]
MKLTRHNGRAGKNGAYNPKHNDRRFDIGNSEHIDVERARQNIYWDCYTGLSSALTREKDKENDYSFEKIEQLYYFEHYADHIQAQNERNEKTRHTERNRTVNDLLTNNKTCPEESIYQIGTVDESVSGETLAKIATEFFAEMEEKFGSHVHILDWALHLDEGTPHIHERHVFDCENKYGELCPQQEKALEELGIPLPNPDKKKGKNNNRKQTFDAECRKMLFRICAKHNLHLQMEPTYGGRGYLEKQDFIIEKQKEKISVQREILTETSQAIEEREKKIGKAEKAIAEREKLIKKHDEVIAEKKQELSQKQAAIEDVKMKLADMETLVDEVAGQAYEKACEVVADTVRQETQKEDIKILDDYSKWLSAPERTDDKKLRNYAVRRLETLKEKFLKSAKGIMEKVAKSLQDPDRKKENLEQVKERARISLKAQLSANQKRVDDYKSQHYGTNMKQAQKDEQSL